MRNHIPTHALLVTPAKHPFWSSTSRSEANNFAHRAYLRHKTYRSTSYYSSSLCFFSCVEDPEPSSSRFPSWTGCDATNDAERRTLQKSSPEYCSKAIASCAICIRCLRFSIEWKGVLGDGGGAASFASFGRCDSQKAANCRRGVYVASVPHSRQMGNIGSSSSSGKSAGEGDRVGDLSSTAAAEGGGEDAGGGGKGVLYEPVGQG